ncbi:hypothetical protein [Micromonospora sp. NPDC050695]|uniref:hypothetical protein n=1 Tax=Micromonospora sp. NPDC050695 TaxID=3154938 RepID=UPI003410CB37
MVIGAASTALAVAAVTMWVGAFTETPTAPSPASVPVAAQRYKPPAVVVADGLHINRVEVAEFVERVVNDPRGWRTDLGQFTVRIVPAGAEGTQPMPGRIGQANPADATVVVSDQAWTTLGPRFAAVGGTLTDQRTWVVLHEVGHLLGHEHQPCPGLGPSPVMRDTNYMLGVGCTFNVWPNP